MTPPAGVIRVASVPADHPYVAHLSEPGEDLGEVAAGGCDTDETPAAGARFERPRPSTTQVVRLPDPPVIAEDGSTRWWPPRMLDVAWLREHADEYDVLHVHFGFESFTPEQLHDAVATAHELGKGVVVTVHDLRNPHVEDPDAQLSRLDALVPAADAVLTLTPGAARAIRARWGREAVVVPHPHVVPLAAMTEHGARRVSLAGDDPDAGDRVADDGDTLDAARVPTPQHAASVAPTQPRIGLHLKSLRPNVDAAGALDALALVADERPNAEIVVTLHRAVTDPSDRGYDAAVVERAEALAARGAITLVLHEPMDDATLFAHVGRLDISVMANVWGTHSGWIEMCHDLGVRVVAPNIGFYGEQRAPLLYELADDAEAIDPSRFADAVLAAIDDVSTRGRPTPASMEDRRSERDAVARTHTDIYRRAREARGHIAASALR